jgi:hypothetical protein
MKHDIRIQHDSTIKDVYQLMGLESILGLNQVPRKDPFVQAILSTAYLNRMPIGYNHQPTNRLTFVWRVEVYTSNGGIILRGTDDTRLPHVAMLIGSDALGMVTDLFDITLPESIPNRDWRAIHVTNRKIKKVEWLDRIQFIRHHPSLTFAKDYIAETEPYTEVLDWASSIIFDHLD